MPESGPSADPNDTGGWPAQCALPAKQRPAPPLQDPASQRYADRCILGDAIVEPPGGEPLEWRLLGYRPFQDVDFLPGDHGPCPARIGRPHYIRADLFPADSNRLFATHTDLGSIDDDGKRDKDVPVGEAIHDAISAGDTKQVKLLVERDPGCVNAPGLDFDTPLIHAVTEAAAGRCPKQLVKYFLENGADWRIANAAGELPLQLAAGYGLSLVVHDFLQSGAAAERTDGDGMNTLMYAAAHGQVDVFNTVLDHAGKDLARVRTEDGLGVLHLAARGGHVDVVRRILEIGLVDVGDHDTSHNTALHFAARNNSLQMCDMLVRHGADAGKLNMENEAPMQLIHWKLRGELVNIVTEGEKFYAEEQKKNQAGRARAEKPFGSFPSMEDQSD